MKKNIAINVKIPEGAEVIEANTKVVNYNEKYAIFTSTAVMKFATADMLAAMLFTAGIFAFPVFENIGIGLMVFSGVSLLVTGFFSLLEAEEIKRVSKRIKKLNGPIDMGENKRISTTTNAVYSRWSEGDEKGNGYIVSQYVRSTRYPVVFNPLRIFKNILINETVWYEPYTDVHTTTRLYAGFAGLKMVTEKCGGPRYSFRRALNSI